MIKSEFKTNIDREIIKSKYPILKSYKNSEGKWVVLFISPDNGMVVYSEVSYYKVGECGLTWLEDGFSTLSDSEQIILSNQSLNKQ